MKRNMFRIVWAVLIIAAAWYAYNHFRPAIAS